MQQDTGLVSIVTPEELRALAHHAEGKREADVYAALVCPAPAEDDVTRGFS